jgi:glycosyltransferase involved in cell wall biosynthesis
MIKKVSFVIPAYNESENIEAFLKELKEMLTALSRPYEIIVINDGSADDTGKKAAEAGVDVISHKENMGYGRSLKDGIRAATGEHIFFIDADGTYDISRIPYMLNMTEKADLVVGKRLFSKKSSHRFKNLTRRFFANQVSYYAQKKVEDLNSGQRVFRKSDIMDDLDKYPDGFSFTSTQVVLYLLKNKRVVYTPVSYEHRGQGSKFLSRKQALAMASLSLRLTFMGRPKKLLLQLGSIVLASGIVTKFAAEALGARGVIYPAIFVIALTLLFFFLLCHIYFFGSRQSA